MNAERIAELRCELDAERIDLVELAEIEDAFAQVPDNRLYDLRENAMASDMLDVLEMCAADKLADCHEENIADGGTIWTHEPTGAYVELIHDDSPSHPLDDVEGIALSFREEDRYCGTMDDHPRDPSTTCQTCDGSGISDRFDLRRDKIIASGTEDAMDAVARLFGLGPWDITSRDCTSCAGTGEIECDLATWFRVEHGARAIYEFSTGSYNEASAVMVVTDDDWTDPAGAAKAWATEYEAWAEGDVWGIEHGGPGLEPESCWGFIGRDHAEEAAAEELGFAIDAARAEHDEAAHCAARDIMTVDA